MVWDCERRSWRKVMKKYLRQKSISQSVDPISEKISLVFVSIGNARVGRTFMTVSRWWHRHKLSGNRITAGSISTEEFASPKKLSLAAFSQKVKKKSLKSFRREGVPLTAKQLNKNSFVISLMKYLLLVLSKQAVKHPQNYWTLRCKLICNYPTES